MKNKHYRRKITLLFLIKSIQRHWFGIMVWIIILYASISAVALAKNIQEVAIVDRTWVPNVNIEVKQARRIHPLETYLKGKGSPLAQYADEIVKLEDWKRVIAITYPETQFCVTGVGSSKNNCGAIRRDSTSFRTYTTKLEGVQDMQILIDKRYKNMTLEQMNGIYCQDDKRPKKKCLGWTEKAESILSEIKNF